MATCGGKKERGPLAGKPATTDINTRCGGRSYTSTPTGQPRHAREEDAMRAGCGKSACPVRGGRTERPLAAPPSTLLVENSSWGRSKGSAGRRGRESLIRLKDRK